MNKEDFFDPFGVRTSDPHPTIIFEWSFAFVQIIFASSLSGQQISQVALDQQYIKIIMSYLEQLKVEPKLKNNNYFLFHQIWKFDLNNC